MGGKPRGPPGGRPLYKYLTKGEPRGLEVREQQVQSLKAAQLSPFEEGRGLGAAGHRCRQHRHPGVAWENEPPDVLAFGFVTNILKSEIVC